MIANCFGLFGITDYDTARRMTLEEYFLRLKGYLVSYIESEYLAYVSAFAHRLAISTNKDGIYLYKQLGDLYDKEERKRSLLGFKQSRQVPSHLYQIAKNIQQYEVRSN